MKNLGDILRLSYEFAKSKNGLCERKDVEQLIATTLSMTRVALYVNFERPMEEEELEKIRCGLKRLIASEPIQYIEGKVSFLSATIEVNKRVLIPRQETEILCRKVLDTLPKTPVKLLDLCTGSGCLAIAIKKEAPHIAVTACDISKEALDCAMRNASVNGVAISFLEGDLFDPIKGEHFDIIVSNPPYISEKEYSCLDPSVREWEPRLALVGGTSGLEFYERIARDAKCCTPSKIWLEIGINQAEGVSNIFKNNCYSRIEVHQDYSSRARFLEIFHENN
jgi:release factor glutamine methyltransferase